MTITPTLMPIPLHERYPRYTQYDPQVPVWDLTVGLSGCFHRFFDTSPISPSGRYAAVLRMPDELRLNTPGESADVILIDLRDGTHRVVASTIGWEAQLGANINWGADDHSLIFNDVDSRTWTPVLIKLDPLTGRSERIDGGVYHVSPDGRYAASASMDRMRRCQRGYGVVIPDECVPFNLGAPDDDGLFITDLSTGDRKLVLPLSRAITHCPAMINEKPGDWHIFGFHSKWSPDGSRLMFTVRRFRRRDAWEWDNIHRGECMEFDVLTCRPDGSDIHNAVPSKYWIRGGHHTTWYPDSQQLSMNLGYFGNGMTLTRVGYDGSDLKPITTAIRGSGHPSVHPCGRIITDTYATEALSFGDGSVPLRWIDVAAERETTLVRMMSTVKANERLNGALRVDAHPAWDRSWRYVVFNGVSENTRHVYLADMAGVLA